jgi:hypothetical protein
VAWINLAQSEDRWRVVLNIVMNLWISGRQLVVREKILVVRGEIWTLFAIFMFIILLNYIIILFQTSSNKYHTNNFVIIKQVHLIKWNFYDHYFIDVCTILKKIHVNGPRDSKL